MGCLDPNWYASMRRLKASVDGAPAGLDEARAVLGIKSEITDEALGRAYHARIKDVHPDHGGDESSAAAKIAEIKKAYGTLKKWRDEPKPAYPSTCSTCQGAGEVQSGFSGIKCPTCKGKGEIVDVRA